MRSGATHIRLGALGVEAGPSTSLSPSTREWLMSLSDSEFDEAVAYMKATGSISLSDERMVRLDRGNRVEASKSFSTLPGAIGSGGSPAAGQRGYFRDGKRYVFNEATGGYDLLTPDQSKNRVEAWVNRFLCRDKDGVAKQVCYVTNGVLVIAAAALLGVFTMATR